MTNESNIQTETRTVGAMLRDARLARGLEVRDLASLTKIQPSMITFLEEDRFEEFSAEVFARGFVRSCARELRMDEDAVLEQYLAQTGATTHTIEIVEAPAPERRADRWLDTSSFGTRAVYAAAMLMLVLGLALSVLVLSGGDDASASAAYAPADASEAWQPVPAGANDWQTYREN